MAVVCLVGGDSVKLHFRSADLPPFFASFVFLTLTDLCVPCMRRRHWRHGPALGEEALQLPDPWADQAGGCDPLLSIVRGIGCGDDDSEQHRERGTWESEMAF